MSDHGWKSMLARISRWLAAPVDVRFDPTHDRPAMRGRSIAPLTQPTLPRERLRFTDPVQGPGDDRRRAQEREYARLEDEITRLVHGDERSSPSEPNGKSRGDGAGDR